SLRLLARILKQSKPRMPIRDVDPTDLLRITFAEGDLVVVALDAEDRCFGAGCLGDRLDLAARKEHDLRCPPQLGASIGESREAVLDRCLLLRRHPPPPRVGSE